MIASVFGFIRAICCRSLLLVLPLAATGLLLSGCDEDAPQIPAPRLVVEGWIDSDGYPEVMLTMSLIPTDSEQSALESVIRWGTVSISDGEQEVILTGGPNDRYFPPYRYYNFNMVGKPGRTYTVKAKYKELTATASARMPYPTPIGHIDVTPVEGRPDWRHLTLHFTAPDDCPAYYQVLVQVRGQNSLLLPAMLSAHEAVKPGEDVSIPVYRSKVSMSLDDYEADFRVGEVLNVALARVEPEVFGFWRAFDNASFVGGSVFVDVPGSLPSNVSGGYGIFSARGTSIVSVLVE